MTEVAPTSVAPRSLRRWRRGIVATSLLLLFLGLLHASSAGRVRGATSARLMRLIDLDAERALGSLWTGALWLLSALVAARLARADPPEGARAWRGLAFLGLFAALDEWLGLHEILNPVSRAVLGAGIDAIGFPWVVAGAAIAIAIGLAFVPFLRRLPAPIARRLLLAGALFLLGALGMETLSAPMLAGGAEVSYRFIALLEEALEIAGVTLLATTLLGLLPDRAPTTVIRLA